MDITPTSSAERERDYYRSLLGLAAHQEPRPMLEEALRLLTDITGAREGYIQLFDDGEPQRVSWSASVGIDESRTDEIRRIISRGIIAEAIATGDVVLTSSATHDPRFSEFESVRDADIEAVICAPIGRETPIGVVYLQGQRAGAERAPHLIVRDVELFTMSILPVARSILSAMQAEAPPRRDSDPGGDAFSAVIGRSPAMREVVKRLRFAAPLDVHVLLTGPTGAGKTLLAHAVHTSGARRGGAFVELNCAALPENLLENELFGADPGAHSAVPRGGVRGKVEQAEGGTLFLDEIAELSLASQSKLLQLLQSKSYYRLGGREPRRANVRVIAATNADLADAVAEHRFREDLYYRLKVLEVRVPALSERSEDLVPLAAHFCRHACRKHEWPEKRLAPSALRALSASDWPGNVRQLANAIESAVIHCQMRGGDRLEARDLFPGIPKAEDEGATLAEATREFQKKYVLMSLNDTDWNVAETSRRLDVARSHLYNLIKLYGLRRSE